MTRTTLRPGFALGMVADWRGQQYELVDIKPYRRRDGRDTLVFVWRSHCLTCGAAFTARAPQYPIRHCSKSGPAPSSAISPFPMAD